MKNNIIILLLIATTTISCIKESQDPDALYGSDTVTAVIEKNETKTYLGQDGLTTLWSAGDEIGIYTVEGSQNLKFTTASAQEAYNGIFKGSLSGQTPQYAYYPYSEAGGDIDGVSLVLSPEQDAKNIADYDFKACVYTSARATHTDYQLSFRGVMSMLAVTVDANNSILQNASLKSVTIKVLPTEGSTTPAVTGEFKMNLVDATTSFEGVGYDYAKLVWNTPHKLTDGKASAYMFINPESVKVGSEIEISFETEEGITATTTVTSIKNCKANAKYDFNLVLAELLDEVVYEGNPLASISFLQSANNGKLLKSSLFTQSYSNKYYTNSETAYDIDCTWNETDQVWEAVIPYLYDFSGLKASFTTLEEGSTVYVNDIEQVSGETANDFNQPVTYVVRSASGITQMATVVVKNTGLPVVTINGTVYPKATDFDDIEGTTTINIDGTDYTCGLRLRGNSTQAMPKKPYAFKLDKKAEILGMPKHKRWVLLANWLDRTMLRNNMAFYIAHQTGRWAPHGQNVEVVLNGVHVGNYYLCEQIKIDEERVNIADYGWEDLVEEVGTPTEQDVADKIGFLLECDQGTDDTEIYFRITTPVPFYVYIKDPGDAATSTGNGVGANLSYNYIKNYFNSVGTAIRNRNWSTVASLIDYQSFADHWMFTELTENQESKHPKSFYMHKDAGGKLCAGPGWDYDWGTFIPASYIGDSRYGEVSSTAGKIQNKYTMRYTMWYQYLFNDPAFVEVVKARWAENYPKFQTSLTYLDQQAAVVKASDEYNHAMWPIEGMIVNQWYSYGFPNQDEDLEFDAAIAQMRTSLQARLEWLNSEISGM